MVAKGSKLSKKTKRKISLGKKGKPSWNKGLKWSKKQKAKLSAIRKSKLASGEIELWNKGKTDIYSEETKRSMGLANKGKHRSKKTEFKKNHKFRGNQHTKKLIL